MKIRLNAILSRDYKMKKYMQELISTVEKLPPQLCEFIKSNENWELYYIGILQIAFDKKNVLAGASDLVYHHNLWRLVKPHFNAKRKVGKMEEQINEAIQKKANSGIRDLFYYPEDRLKEEFFRIKGNYVKRGISKEEVTMQIWILFDKLKVNHVGNGDRVINFSLSDNYVALGSFTGWVEKEFGERPIENKHNMKAKDNALDQSPKEIGTGQTVIVEVVRVAREIYSYEHFKEYEKLKNTFKRKIALEKFCERYNFSNPESFEKQYRIRWLNKKVIPNMNK